MRINSTRNAVLYLTAVFVVGLAVGCLGGFTAGLVWKFKLPAADEVEAKIYEDLKSKLHLRQDQESAVRVAVHEMVLEFAKALNNAATSATNAVVVCQHRIEPTLDAPQRQILSNIVADGIAKRKR